jgi:hypothetical protein
VTDMNPLTPADKEQIDEAMKRLDAADSLVERARLAGIDVEPFRQRAREARERLTKIRQAFFAGQ